uniref:Uncharacterized protein n=1 Tax=Octopus bimaculoides TaxID=37653 RepID=A0A0L8FJX8_OCTBM
MGIDINFWRLHLGFSFGILRLSDGIQRRILLTRRNRFRRYIAGLFPLNFCLCLRQGRSIDRLISNKWYNFQLIFLQFWRLRFKNLSSWRYFRNCEVLNTCIFFCSFNMERCFDYFCRF